MPLHHPLSPEGHPQSPETQNSRLQRPPCGGVLPRPRPLPPHPRPPPVGHRHGQTPLPPDWANAAPSTKRGTGPTRHLARHSVCSHGGQDCPDHPLAPHLPSTWTPTYPPASRELSWPGPHTTPSSSRTTSPTWTQWASSLPPSTSRELSQTPLGSFWKRSGKGWASLSTT